MTQDAKSDRVEVTEKQRYAAIYRLCHFVPLDSSDNFCYAVQEFLVLHAMATLGVIRLLPSEVRDSVKNLFGLDFELGEIEFILGRLHKAQEVVYVDGEYWLAYQKCLELRRSVKDCNAFETKVIKDWLKSIEHKYPELSKDDLQRFEKDFKIFAAKIFAQHGAKCTALIYAKKKKIAEVVDKLETLVPDILPEYPVLDKIRRTELPAFFKDAEGERRKYIAELLDSSFLLHAIQVDKKCSMIIKEILKGRLLYLDTTVLYALFDLDTPRETRAVRRLIELSQQLEYTTVVTPKTLEEFKYSLNLAEKHLKKYSDIPKNFAKAAANHSAGGFIPAYWRKYAKTGISREDFIGTYRNFENLLAEYKIEIRDDFCAEVQEDPELQTQIDLLYASEGLNFIDSNIAEHDAFHRLLIKKVRGGKALTFSTANAWFLTVDKKLNRYDYFASSKEKNKLSEVPFCILCDDWFQFIRPLLPRTDADSDKIFIDLLSSPYFRSFEGVPPELAEKIIGRLAHFKNYSAEMAVKMLTDSFFIHQLETINSEDQEEHVDEKIIAVGEEIMRERNHYKEQFEKTSKAIKMIEEEGKVIKIQLREKESDFVSKKVEYEKVQEGLKKKLENLTIAYNSFAKHVKWTITSVIWIFIVMALILVLMSGLELGIKILLACASIFGFLITLAIPLGWWKTYRLIIIIGAVAHIVALTYLAAQHLAWIDVPWRK
jgi:predicted nucleic acid-binding protein